MTKSVFLHHYLGSSPIRFVTGWMNIVLYCITCDSLLYTPLLYITLHCTYQYYTALHSSINYFTIFCWTKLLYTLLFSGALCWPLSFVCGISFISVSVAYTDWQQPQDSYITNQPEEPNWVKNEAIKLKSHSLEVHLD